MSSPRSSISLDGITFTPAEIEGGVCVFKNPQFKLVKRPWQPDHEVAACPICSSKFGGLKRRHHCRQCGLVVCNKCCNEKVPLPQLGIPEPEKICERCLPVTTQVTKSRSTLAEYQLAAAKSLAAMCKNSERLPLLFQYGGFHTLLALGKIQLTERNMEVMSEVSVGLHTLSTYEPLHDYMVSEGIMMALCEILKAMAVWQENVLLDCLSALMIYCKSPHTAAIVRDQGCLATILELCSNVSDTVALMSVSCLSLLVVHPATHEPIINGDRQALQRLLALAASDSDQMQAVALKCLNYLSMGNDWNKHRIVQEDYSAGRPMKAAIQNSKGNMQVLANAVCLVANLATSAEDQAALSECLDSLLEVLQTDITNRDLLFHLTRAIANFSHFQQNAPKLVNFLSLITWKCLKSTDEGVAKHGTRVELNLLKHKTKDCLDILLSDGAGNLLETIVSTPDMLPAMMTVLLKQFPEHAKPL